MYKTKEDEFAKKYKVWCVKEGYTPGTDAIRQFHYSNKVPVHPQCNYCIGGGMK